jgi:pimeloyl-ACP methyl ester carboxylesterase
MVGHFSKALRIVASDIRGHGDSHAVFGGRITHWRVFADDLRDVVERVMPPPVIGVGHSLGAVCTAMAAALYPGLFSCVVLLDPVILPRKTLWIMRLVRAVGLGGAIPIARGARRRRKRFRDKEKAFQRFSVGRGVFRGWDDDFIHAYLECGLLVRDDRSALLKCDPEVEAQIFESVPLDVWSYVRKLTCPVLAIRGEHSGTFSSEVHRRLGGLAADYTAVTVPGTGHFFPMEAPRRCAGAIEDYLISRGFIG